jgi:hypothetical protein
MKSRKATEVEVRVYRCTICKHMSLTGAVIGLEAALRDVSHRSRSGIRNTDDAVSHTILAFLFAA